MNGTATFEMPGITTSRNYNEAEGIFVALFAQPITTILDAPKGRYDAEKQLYVDAAGDPIVLANNTTYCQVSWNVDTCGKGCDDEIHYEACD